jgi:hypothetical protein
MHRGDRLPSLVLTAADFIMASKPKGRRGRAKPDSSPGFTIVDPVVWNLSWEARASDFIGSHEIGESWGEVDETFLAAHRACFEGLCFLQYDLSLSASEYYALGFEGRWRNVAQGVRQKHMLEGHVRTCMADEGDAVRSYCSDICLEPMASDSGKLFLDLLQRYLLDDITRPSATPITYPYPGSTSRSTVMDAFAFARDTYLCQ